MLNAHTTSPENAARKQSEANALGQGINTNELETAASNAHSFSAALSREGRINEAAFWAKMHSNLRERLVDIANGADARRERVLYHDLLRCRLFDLRIAVNADDYLTTAKPDSATNRNLRRSMTEQA